MQNPLDLDHCDYGFQRGRRRQGAMLVQMCMAWRATSLNASWWRTHFDLRNAFMTPVHEEMDMTLRKLFKLDIDSDIDEPEYDTPEEVVCLLRQIYKHAVVEMRFFDGETLLAQPGCGGLMGNPSIVIIFGHTFLRPVRIWQKSQTHWDSEWAFAMAKCPVTGAIIDLSLTKFADDTTKTLFTRTADAPTMAKKMTETTDRFSRYLGDFGMAQNTSKLESVFHFAGTGSTNATRAVYRQEVRTYGKLKQFARLLGGQLQANNRTFEERKNRIQQTVTAFRRLGQFWISKSDFTVKRTAFICVVLGTALSGSEAFVFTKNDNKSIDKVICRLGRKAMCGKAWDGKRAASNIEVLTYWQVASSRIENQIRRLKWLQNMSRDISNNVQLIAAIWGQLGAETSGTLNENGETNEDANPWAKQWEDDLAEISEIEEFWQIWEGAKKDIRRFMWCGEIRNRFLEFDFSFLRFRFLRFGARPEEHLLEYADPDLDIDDEINVRCFMCTLKSETGECCGADFATRKGLFAHMRMQHGIFNNIWTLCCGNVCFWCNSSFKCRRTAYQHMLNSMLNDRCRADAATAPHEWKLPKQLCCGICSHQAQDWSSYKRHAATHVKPPAEIVQYGSRCKTTRVDGGTATEKPDGWKTRTEPKSGARPRTAGKSFGSARNRRDSDSRCRAIGSADQRGRSAGCGGQASRHREGQSSGQGRRGRRPTDEERRWRDGKEAQQDEEIGARRLHGSDHCRADEALSPERPRSEGSVRGNLCHIRRPTGTCDGEGSAAGWERLQHKDQGDDARSTPERRTRPTVSVGLGGSRGSLDTAGRPGATDEGCTLQILRRSGDGRKRSQACARRRLLQGEGGLSQREGQEVQGQRTAGEDHAANPMSRTCPTRREGHDPLRLCAESGTSAEGRLGARSAEALGEAQVNAWDDSQASGCDEQSGDELLNVELAGSQDEALNERATFAQIIPQNTPITWIRKLVESASDFVSYVSDAPIFSRFATGPRDQLAEIAEPHVTRNLGEGLGARTDRRVEGMGGEGDSRTRP